MQLSGRRDAAIRRQSRHIETQGADEGGGVVERVKEDFDVETDFAKDISIYHMDLSITYLFFRSRC